MNLTKRKMLRLSNFNFKQIKDISFVMQASSTVNIKTNVSQVVDIYKLTRMRTTVRQNARD